jgi:hypothetical protein
MQIAVNVNIFECGFYPGLLSLKAEHHLKIFFFLLLNLTFLVIDALSFLYFPFPFFYVFL